MQHKQKLTRMETGRGVVAEILIQEGWSSYSGEVTPKRHR